VRAVIEVSRRVRRW